jgi:hypothetical protein
MIVLSLASRMTHGLLSVCELKFWVSSNNLGRGLSASQKPENHVDRDAQAADAGLAIALLRVHGNSVKSYSRHPR